MNYRKVAIDSLLTSSANISCAPLVRKGYEFEVIGPCSLVTSSSPTALVKTTADRQILEANVYTPN